MHEGDEIKEGKYRTTISIDALKSKGLYMNFTYSDFFKSDWTPKKIYGDAFYQTSLKFNTLLAGIEQGITYQAIKEEW